MSSRNKQRKSNRDAFRKMDFKERLAYIFEYYKLPMFTACVALIVAITSTIHTLTKKEPVLYLAYINTAVGDTLNTQLTDDFLSYMESNPKKTTVTVYKDLYISDDASVENHEYAYASKMKIIGAISARNLDVVLMNREACDLMSESGFLLDLSELEDSDLYAKIEPLLVINEVIIDDNAIEYRLNEAEEYVYTSEKVPNAVDVSDLPLFKDAGFNGDLYLGIIANTKHPIGSAAFISYITEPAS